MFSNESVDDVCIVWDGFRVLVEQFGLGGVEPGNEFLQELVVTAEGGEAVTETVATLTAPATHLVNNK